MRILRVIAAAIVAIPALAVMLTAGEPDGAVEAAPVHISLPNPGPYGPVTVIGDSVLLGSGYFSPTLPDQLAARGWGPIRFQAGEGYTSGYFPVQTSFRASSWIDTWQAQGWDPEHVIVNIGANDSGFCKGDVACARASILHLVNAIGPGHQIWWPQITRLYTHFDEQNAWNVALRQIAAERDDFHTWDWPTEMATQGYSSHDWTHLDPAGYRRRSARMADVFTLEFARGTSSGVDVPLPEPTAAPSSFVPLDSARIVDTRFDPPGRQFEGDVLRVDFGDLLPEGTTAVALYVGAARPSEDGYLAAGPCGVDNSTATLNFQDLARGAPTLTAVGDGDDVCILTVGETDVVVDLQGAFVGGDEGLEFDPLPTPDRLLDSRRSGRIAEYVLEAPSGAEAVALNLTAANAESVGFLVAKPCGTETDVANLNFRPGPPIAASAIVTVGETGTVCVTANVPADVIVDITGAFRSDGRLSFVPVPPTRTLDTRSGAGGWSPIHGSGQTIDVRVAPPGAEAVTGTVTLVRPLATTFVSGFACEGDPPTSSVNAGWGDKIANSLTVAVTGDGRLCLTASSATNTIVDTTGWWVAS